MPSPAPLLPRFAFAALFAASLGTPALADDSGRAADARAAREHAARGERLASDGDREGALLELREAYELVPSPAVLLQIARLHASLDRPIAAKRALDRLLAFPGALSRDKLDEALRLQASEARRIAHAHLIPQRPATLTVDARPVGAGDALTGDLVVALDPGRHVVTAAAPESVPAVRVIELAPGATEEVFLELLPMPGAAAGALVVRAELPGADVVVDGHVVAVTPVAGPIPVPPGAREVWLARPGYRAAPRTVEVRGGQANAVELEAEVDPAVSASVTGRVVVRASEPDVSVTLNGLPRGPYKEPLLLPAGLHRLKLERKGFEPLERTIDVPAGGELVVVATLEPTPATRASLAAEAHARRRWGWIAIGAGAAASVAATSFIVWNEHEMSDAQRALDAVDASERSGGTCDPMLPTTDAAACARTRSAAEDRVVTLDFRRVLGGAALGLGLGAVGMGLVHVLTGPAPDQYDLPQAPLPMARAPGLRLTLAPLLDALGGPAGAVVVGAF